MSSTSRPLEHRTLVSGRLVAAPAGAALVAEALAWALLAAPGTLSPAWYGVPRLLAAVHLLTLGTLALSVLGFSWQLVPVVTAAAPPRWWEVAAGWLSALLLSGVALLCGGMLQQPPGLLAAAGGALVLGGLLARAGLVGGVLITATGRRAIRGWLLAAEACLVAGAILGALLLAGRTGHPVLSDPITGIGWHASLLLLGWIGGWIGGLACVLLPMFSVSSPPHPALIAAAGLAWFGGLALGSPMLWALGAVALALGLLRSLHRRLQRRAGPGMAVAAVGLAGLLAVTGVALLAGGAPLAAAALVLFALPMLRGVALRIGPFLMWSHLFRDQMSSAPPVSALVPQRLAWAAGGMALLGGALVFAGISAAMWPLARLGAAVALLGTLCHAGVMAAVLARTHRHRNRLAALPGMGEP